MPRTNDERTIEEVERQEGHMADDETTPLIHSHGQSSTTHSKNNDKSASRFSLQLPIPLPIRDETLVPALSMLIVFLNESEFYIKQVSLVRAIEAMACFEYYTSHDDPLADLGKSIPERWCKKTPIHERVAAVYGLMYVIRMLSAILGSVFVLTYLKAGPRRTVNVLHKTSLLVSNAFVIIGYLAYPKLPIWFMCLGGLATIFAGNLDLSLSAMFGAYADVISDPARRSNLIFMTNSMQYLSQFVCLPLAGWMMNLDGSGNTPQIALWASCVCAVLVFVLTVGFFPETYKGETTEDHHHHHHHHARSKSDASISSEDTTDDRRQTRSERMENTKSSSSSSSARPFGIVLKEFGPVRTTLLMSSMLFCITGTRLIDWYGLLQYPSIKFEWMMSQTTYLITFQAVITFLVFIFVLPAINTLLQTQLHVSARQTSLGIILASSLLITISSILFGLPSTGVRAFVAGVVVYTFGSGFASALQTYVLSVSPTPRGSGAALTVMSLGNVAGKFLASALWPVLLSVGLTSPWRALRGLPFFVAAALAVGSAVAVFAAEGWESRWKLNGRDGIGAGDEREDV